MIDGDEVYEASCALFNLLSLLVPSINSRRLLVDEFNSYHATLLKDSIPDGWKAPTYDEIEQTVAKKTCIMQMIRKVPFCIRCNRFIKSDCPFCPECMSHKALFPVWNNCKTKKCFNESDIVGLLRDYCNGMNWHEVKKRALALSCKHKARSPFFQCAYYIPPIAVIMELLRTKAWDNIPYTAPSDLLDVVTMASIGNCHALTASNVGTVLDRWRYCIIPLCIRNMSTAPSKEASELLKIIIGITKKNSDQLDSCLGRNTPEPIPGMQSQLESTNQLFFSSPVSLDSSTTQC